MTAVTLAQVSFALLPGISIPISIVLGDSLTSVGVRLVNPPIPARKKSFVGLGVRMRIQSSENRIPENCSIIPPPPPLNFKEESFHFIL